MPVTITWDNAEHSVIRVIFEKHWEVGDLFRTIDEVTQMIDSVNHMVDSIFDLTHSSISPPRLLSTLDRMEERYCKNERLLVIVGASAYIKSLAKIAKVLAPKTFAHVHFADDVHAAYVMIARQSQANIA